ncbi:aspartate dehydrogenase [Oceanibium sediminis]|uniref:aspartate dehydrogenase n=1 Tax=Oceanibium sediminis TaxID=2026339 RepID=UPI000DD3997A|nr:aspartate dehydrogenase [Oceanibium sediminis]
MQHLALIGFGAIGQTLVTTLCESPDAPLRKLTLLVRETAMADTRQRAEGICAGHGIVVDVHSDIAAVLAAKPDLVVECAGHGAVVQYGPAVLSAGIDLLTASVGAFADAALLDRLKGIAADTGVQILLPAGAIAGIDALGAARLSGIHEVTYVGRKPPAAWTGTEAEQHLDLASLSEEAVFFDGTAREAAARFPKNANVAATVALAGVGMDATRVRLIADPIASGNTHELHVSSNAMDLTLQVTGNASPLNPKTSLSTAYSLARAVLNRSAAINI